MNHRETLTRDRFWSYLHFRTIVSMAVWGIHQSRKKETFSEAFGIIQEKNVTSLCRMKLMYLYQIWEKDFSFLLLFAPHNFRTYTAL